MARRTRIVVLGMLLVLVNLAFLVFPRASYNAVVVHHSASQVADQHSIRWAHQQRGWFEIAYHFVLSNGSTPVPRGHLYPTRRYTWGLWSVATRNPRFNLTALHLCVVGNFEEAQVPTDLRAALGNALAEILDRHDISSRRIFLHRECSASACPGKNITKDQLIAWTEGASTTNAIRAQHQKALDRWRLTRGWFNGLWLLANLGLGWAMLRRRARPSPVLVESTESVELADSIADDRSPLRGALVPSDPN